MIAALFYWLLLVAMLAVPLVLAALALGALIEFAATLINRRRGSFDKPQIPHGNARAVSPMM